MQPLADDTAPHVEAQIITLLRAMPAWKKLELARDMNRMADTLALVGLRRRLPDASPETLAFRLAVQRLGAEAHPDTLALFQEVTFMPDMPADPLTIARRVGTLLDTLAIPYVVGGSVAAIVHGEYRMTRDLDVVIRLTARNTRRLAEALEPDFILRAADISDAIDMIGIARDDSTKRATFCAFDRASGFQVDFFLSSGRPFERSQFSRAIVVPLPGELGEILRVASAEDTVLAKLEWFRITPSDRQWRDIQAILRVQGDALDDGYLQHWANQLGVADLLAWALRGEHPPALGGDPHQQRMF